MRSQPVSSETWYDSNGFETSAQSAQRFAGAEQHETKARERGEKEGGRSSSPL